MSTHNIPSGNAAANDTPALAPEILTSFINGVEKIRRTLRKHGLPPSTVATFDISLHARYPDHPQDKMSYEIRIKSQGSLVDAMQSQAKSLDTLPPYEQGLLLFFELAFNLDRLVPDIVAQKHDIDKTLIQRGGGMPMTDQAQFSVIVGCDPGLYLDGLNELLDVRLKMLLPPQTHPSYLPLAVRPATKPPRL